MNRQPSESTLLHALLVVASLASLLPLIGIPIGLTTAIFSLIPLLRNPQQTRELLAAKHLFKTEHLHAEMRRLQKQKFIYPLVIAISLFGIIGQIGFFTLLINAG